MDISRDKNIVYIGNPKYINKRIKELPIWEKELLTVVEAAKYFGIGEQRIREITRKDRDKPYIYWRDNHVYIRRKEFESYLDSINEL